MVISKNKPLQSLTEMWRVFHLRERGTIGTSFPGVTNLIAGVVTYYL